MAGRSKLTHTSPNHGTMYSSRLILPHDEGENSFDNVPKNTYAKNIKEKMISDLEIKAIFPFSTVAVAGLHALTVHVFIMEICRQRLF